MRLINIEAGPWGGLVLLLIAVAAFAALYFTTWVVSGLALVVVVIVPIGLVVYFGGRRLGRRLIHGSSRR